MPQPSPDPEWDACWAELNHVLDHGPSARADSLCQLLLGRAEQMTALAEPDAAERMAAVRFTQGVLASWGGDHAQADSAFRAAVPFAARAVAERPDDPARRDRLASLHYNLGNSDSAHGRHAAAEAAYRAALPLQEANARERPDVSGLRNRVAQTKFNLGNACMSLNRPAEAAGWFHEARTLWLKLVEEEPAVVGHAHNLARSYFNFAYVAVPAGRAAEAADAYQRAQAVWERLLHEFGEDVEQRCDIARCYHNHSIFLVQSGRHEEALPAVERALPHFDRLVALAPNDATFRQLRDQAYAQRDWLRDHPPAQVAARQIAEGERQAAAARRAGDWQRLRQLGSGHLELASDLGRSHRPREMEQVYRAALALVAEAARLDPSPDSAHLEAAVWFDFNLDLRALGYHDGAEEAVRTALRRWQALHERFPQDARFQQWLGGAYNNLGIICADTGRSYAAEVVYRIALALRETAARTGPGPENQLYLGGCLCNLGNVYRDRGQLDVARDFYTRAIRTIEAVQAALATNALVGQYVKNAHDGLAACASRPALDFGQFQTATMSWPLAGPPALTFDGVDSALTATLRRIDQLRLARDRAAEQATAELVTTARSCAEAWLLRGLVLAHLDGEPGKEAVHWTDERHEEAIAAFHEALVCRPNYFEAKLYKGVALGQAADAAQVGLRVLASAVEARPDAEREGYLAPCRLRFQCDLARARESLESAGRIRPEDGRPWYQLAALFHGLGYAREAQPFLEKLRATDEAWWSRVRAEFAAPDGQ